MSGPLEGLRVVDCSRGTAGARMTWFLADYGADVIWVEPPGGDPWRDDLAVDYSVYQRNKRSVELDLRDAASRETLFELLGTADLFVETWRPGVAERAGARIRRVARALPGPRVLLDLGLRARLRTRRPARLRRARPRGCGDAALGSSVTARARSSWVSRRPATARRIWRSIGVLAALYRRESDGWGRRVETSLVDGVAAYMAQAWGAGRLDARRDEPGAIRHAAVRHAGVPLRGRRVGGGQHVRTGGVRPPHRDARHRRPRPAGRGHRGHDAAVARRGRHRLQRDPRDLPHRATEGLARSPGRSRRRRDPGPAPG